MSLVAVFRKRGGVLLCLRCLGVCQLLGKKRTLYLGNSYGESGPSSTQSRRNNNIEYNNNSYYFCLDFHNLFIHNNKAQHRPSPLFQQQQAQLHTTSTVKKEETYYQLLGISPTATEDEIKKAFKTLSKVWHPDVNASKGQKEVKHATEKYKRMCAAYRCLSNAGERRIYNNSIATKVPYSPPVAPFEAPAYQYRSTYDKEHFESPYKFFSNSSIVWLALAMMVVATIGHYYRIKGASDELSVYLNTLSRQARQDYEKVRQRAIANGYEKQLDILRENHKSSSIASRHRIDRGEDNT
eukprot:m.128484 g.128484  ORF g.128484 m.128484 type:complete len:297 (-) comp13028_c1_seq6:1376-2266(-)